MRKTIKYLMMTALAVFLFCGCSTTKRLGEHEVLYTGQKPTIVKDKSKTLMGVTALEEVDAALDKAPNNALLGSPYYRIPFPIGLWIYNDLYGKKGIWKWVFNKLGSKPILVADVNPGVRTKAATNVLHEYGYFNGNVDYQLIPNKKNDKKAKIQYTVNMEEPYMIDSVAYRGFNERTTYLLKKSKKNTLLPKGTQFNVEDLQQERVRLSNMLRNAGYYFFRPDYFTYEADTTIVPNGHVYLRMIPIPEMSPKAEQPFYIGKVAVTLLGRNGEMPNDTLNYKGLNIYYYNKPYINPKRMYQWLDYDNYQRKQQLADSSGVAKKDALSGMYSLHRQNRIQSRLNNLGVFRYLEMQYQPNDTTYRSDTLDLNIIAAPERKYSAELDGNYKIKSNDQTGPNASFTLTQNNVFGGGETWKVALNAGYEWQMGKDKSNNLNSYQLGVTTSLIFPRILLPRFSKRIYDFPATTTLKLYGEQQNRARYYRMIAFGGNITYDLFPNKQNKHSFTPFKLTFNVLKSPTKEFEDLRKDNPALYVSLHNQFIPAMEYTYTFDNAFNKQRKNVFWWQPTFVSAGNITSLVYKLAGQDFHKKQKTLLGVPFAQFLKLNSELRYHYKINKNHTIAAKFIAGVLWSYGNMETAPYTEQFYVGGANSIRAFAPRSIGPGGEMPSDDKFAFLNHVGDVKLETSLEYRFRIINNLHGAVFMDAGNVWLLKHDKLRPLGQIRWNTMWKQIALGTGAGLRYDLDFLVFRLDLGIALHDPYDTGKSGYYNITDFKKSMVLNFAIGYPF